MARVNAYDVSAGVQLLQRALERSGLDKKSFARDELVRDESTLHGYFRGDPMPEVVRAKLRKLAQRRRPLAR